jgi:hypothetical protein
VAAARAKVAVRAARAAAEVVGTLLDQQEFGTWRSHQVLHS